MMGKNEIRQVENAFLREKYYYIDHKSGLQIYVFPKCLSTCYALFATKYGAVDNCFRIEGKGAYQRMPDGIAHFLEHKLFETEDDVTTDARFAALGASSNAFTSADMTAYEFSCTENVYESLAVLLEFVSEPYFTKENIAKEQGIIDQEIDMGDDAPMRRLYYELLNALYTVNPTRINVCGTHASIAEITPEHLYTCYRAFYQPSNMFLVVCGDVTPERVLALADEKITAGPSLAVERREEAEPPRIAQKIRYATMQIARPLFAIGVKDDCGNFGTAESVRRSLVLRIAGDWLFGSSSSFFEAAYRDGLLNNRFSAEYENYRTCGFFLFSGETDKPKEVYQRIIEELAAFQKAALPREDFSRIQKALYAEYIRDFDSTEEIANNLLSYRIFGVDLFDVGDIIHHITYEETVETIRSFFAEERFGMAVLMPSASADRIYYEKR